MTKRRLIRWAIIIISIYIIVTTLSAMVDLVRARDKLTRREVELAQLQNQHDDLLRQKNKVDAPGFLEKVARDQLGLSKPGEEVVIIPEDLLASNPIASSDATPNWKRWARLLF